MKEFCLTHNVKNVKTAVNRRSFVKEIIVYFETNSKEICSKNTKNMSICKNDSKGILKVKRLSKLVFEL